MVKNECLNLETMEIELFEIPEECQNCDGENCGICDLEVEAKHVGTRKITSKEADDFFKEIKN